MNYKLFKQHIQNHQAKVGVIGLGYVGLPLILEFCNAGFPVCGFDVDEHKIKALRDGKSYINHIAGKSITAMVKSNRFDATTKFTRLKEVDVIIICVPTPLSRHREPDMSYIYSTGNTIATNLKKGHLVILESTTYPGTTTEKLRPILEKSGLKAGRDFYLAYSPEREDPGNPVYATRKIPKVVGASDKSSLNLASNLYGQIVVQIVPVSSTETAEAVKLTENIFRSVNIAMVNELKMIFTKMGIDIWEVIDAAKTKPFGFMPFYPGPGLGGHCIPIDPFYLTWKAREHECATRFIELAGEVNTSMPEYVVHMLVEGLNRHKKSINGSKILIVGLAYKKDVDDDRESPSYKLIKILRAKGAKTDYYDPFIPFIRPTREYPELTGEKSIPWRPESIARYDAVLIVTDHSKIDYEGLVKASKLVIDTRNATKDLKTGHKKIIKA